MDACYRIRVSKDHHGLWRWRVLDMGEMVATGTTLKWIEARVKARKACRVYAARIAMSMARRKEAMA